MGTNQRAQIVMSDDEVREFIEQSRTCTMATVGPNGIPHLVAMWYGVIDGKIYFETKTKSQKVANLNRDPSIACMIEAGDTYDQLRGITVEGTAHIISDTEDPEYWAAGVSVYERYNGPYTEETKSHVEMMLHKRVIVRIDPVRVRSWDHRKLGMPQMPLAGTTAEFL
ncbi:MAG: PPOX class F420-dependent oxidoreductase [Acidimicrobiales bacterium]|nr:PPOX class F420-dependent oxidoreductase [Acidimicrobiales bacterium]